MHHGRLRALLVPPEPHHAPALHALHARADGAAGAVSARGRLTAQNACRETLVPSARAYPLEALLEDCVAYFRATSRRITFEYTLLGGTNDAPEQVRGTHWSHALAVWWR
jgi:adenine C2-methylase RlmN of 23S rRNA A2503 and tRNA A37